MQKIKRVLFVCSLYHPHVGGIETMINELSNYYKTQGIASVILTKRWPLSLSQEDIYQSIPIYRVVSARTEEEFESIISWIKIHEDKVKSDIIHVIGVRRPLPLIALLLSQYWKVPLLSTIAGSEIPSRENPQTADIWNEGKCIMEPVLKASDMVSCVSKSLQQDLALILPEIKSVLLYAGIEVDLIKSIQAAPNGNFVISLRRLIPSKGVDVLIRAFKDVLCEYPTVRLIIAGEGPEEEKLKTLVSDLGMDNNVTFTGTVSFSHAISLLKSALCTVVPSLSEGGGLVNVEAQVAGCPVIASNVGGIPEYVKDNESGLLFQVGNDAELASKIKLILSDISLRNRLITGGFKHSLEFDWNKLGPQYLAIYKKMIKVYLRPRFNPWSPLTNNLWKLLNK